MTAMPEEVPNSLLHFSNMAANGAESEDELSVVHNFYNVTVSAGV